MEEDFKEIMHSSSTAASLQQIMEVEEEEEELSDDDTSSFTGVSSGSGSVCSSNSIVADDACSSSCCSLESEMDMKDGLEANGNGPLYELSSLLAQLPLRRGLSKFYMGKSQSFTSLSDATSIDDLAKKEATYSTRMKICRSYPGRLDKKQRPICPPTKVISKRQARGSFGTLVPKMRRTLPFQLNSCGMPT